MENACGFCIGNHMSPGTDAVSLRTSNRNFEGRSGTLSAQIYLVSPETAAAASLAGVFTDPRACEAVPAAVEEPAAFDVDDSMFLFRETAGRGVPETAIVRGPNIGEVPAGKPLPETLNGVAAVKVGDKITTDHIMPAGARLKYRSNVPQYAKYVFEHVDAAFYKNASAIRDAGRHVVIVAGESYGQGSSREHAAMCPMYLGVKAVLARSIERIHCANLINFGIVPLLFDRPEDYEAIKQGDELTCVGFRAALAGDGKVTFVNVTRGNSFTATAALSGRQKRIVLNGGLLAAVASGHVS
jgi:aconitate hydratase